MCPNRRKIHLGVVTRAVVVDVVVGTVISPISLMYWSPLGMILGLRLRHSWPLDNISKPDGQWQDASNPPLKWQKKDIKITSRKHQIVFFTYLSLASTNVNIWVGCMVTFWQVQGVRELCGYPCSDTWLSSQELGDFHLQRLVRYMK